PGPKRWDDSPLRDSREVPQPRVIPEPEVAEVPAARAAAAARATPSRGRTTALRAVPQERSAPTAVTRIGLEDGRKATRADGQLAPAGRRNDVALRAADRRRRLSGEDRSKLASADGRRQGRAGETRQGAPRPPPPAADGARPRAEGSRGAGADRRGAIRGRQERDDRQAVALVRVSAVEPRASRGTARGLEAERSKTAKTLRAGRRGAEGDATDDTRAAGKYTVQL